MKKASALADWTPEEIALGKKWIETWKLAAEDLERRSANYTTPPYAPKPWSGLVEMQDWFKKAAGRD